MDLSFKITGIRLKEIRENSGLSTTEVGKKLRKYHNVKSSIENGSADPSIVEFTIPLLFLIFIAEFTYRIIVNSINVSYNSHRNTS